MQKICEICGFTTDNSKVFANHIRWKHKSTKDSEAYNTFITKLSTTQTKPRVTKSFVCPVCNKQFELTGLESYFNSARFLKYKHCCSSKCAHTRIFSEEAKQAFISKLSKYAKEHPSGFASPEFIQNGATKTHSKRELEIVDYFKANFPDDKWKQGFIIGNVKYDGYYLNPDLHSNKLKVIIEYDGIWHFKDINGQLDRKQAADRALVKWCKENNYRLIRIDEDLNITNEQIVDAVYNSDVQLELFNSNRYDYLI